MNQHPAGDRSRYVQKPGRGQRFDIDGAIITLKAAEAEPAGQFTLFEITLPPHLSGAAAHVHRQTTEWFYVLSGTLAFTLNEETVMARPGSSILVLPGMIHAFWNPTASVATLLGFCSRANFADYLSALTGLLAMGSAASSDKHWALAAQYDQFPPGGDNQGWDNL